GEKASNAKAVGLVTCLYRAVPGRTVWSKLEALGVAADFIPGALTSRFIERGLHFGLGSTLAVKREALKAIGGMEPLVDYLADDYELASRIVKANYRVTVPKVTVETFLPNYSFAGYFQHQLRWGRTVRSCRPASYLGLLITFGFFWATLNVIATCGTGWSWMLLAIVLVLRVVVLCVSARSIL